MRSIEKDIIVVVFSSSGNFVFKFVQANVVVL